MSGQQKSLTEEKGNNKTNKMGLFIFLFLFSLVIAYFIFIETWHPVIKVLIFMVTIFFLIRTFLPKNSATNDREIERMDKSWDSLTPRELRNAKLISILFLVVSLVIFIFLSKIIGGILLAIWILFGSGSFVLGSRSAIKNKIHVLKTVEHGYNDWENKEIEKQIQAIEECGYKWFEQKGRVGFKHTKTGLYLKIEGLHFYKPEEIKRVYREVWSKDDPSRIRNVEATAQKMAEAISSGATDEEIEFILEEHKQKKTK